MTTGEIIGIVVGVAGLGVGAYVLIDSRKKGDPSQANPGTYYQRPPQPVAPAYTQQPPDQVQQVVATVGQVAGTIGQLFSTFENIFGGA